MIALSPKGAKIAKKFVSGGLGSVRAKVGTKPPPLQVRCHCGNLAVKTAAVDVLWKIFAALSLVALNGYFVAIEFAAVSARESRLEVLARKNLVARMALHVKRKLD